MTYKQNQASIKSKEPRVTYSPKQETHRLRVSQARWASQLNWSANALSAGLIASATFFFMVGQVNQGVLATVGGVCSTASHSRLKEWSGMPIIGSIERRGHSGAKQRHQMITLAGN
jgi:hypothetical protein